MKKILAMLLAVALTVALAAPAISTTATAAEYNPYHCECGAKVFASADEETPSIKNEKCMDGCAEEKNLTWKPISELAPDGKTGEHRLTASGNYYVPADTEIGYIAKIVEGITLRIDLYGNTLARTNNQTYHVNFGTLVITDTSANKDGVLTSRNYSTTSLGGVIKVERGTVKQFAGTVKGQGAGTTNAIATGGTVGIANGDYYMYDGAIIGGYATNGGNVHLTKVDSKFYMYDGTISGGQATNSGGNVALYNNATFYMDGGVIENGSTITGDNKHGGNIRVCEGAEFIMTGGTVKDGVANGKEGSYPSKGGNIMATGTNNVTGGDGSASTVSISGDAKILGGTAKEPTTNSIWINTGAVLNISGGHIEKEILVVGTAKVTGDQLTLTGDLKLSAPLNIAENVTINLAGHKIANGVNVAEGVVLTLVDTSTDNYETAGAMLKVTGAGTVKSDAVVNSKRYVAIAETVTEGEGDAAVEVTYYSAHRIYLAVTGSVLSNGCSAMNFKTMLKCNNYVAQRITEYGVIVNGVAFAYEGTVAAGANEKTTQLTGFLKGDAGDADFAATDVQVNATIKLGETVINSAVKTRSLKTMVETVAQGWADLDADQQTTLKNLYKDFGATAGMDSWNIPTEMKAN